MSNLIANFNSSANFTSQITGITSIKHLSRFTRAQLLRVSLNTKLYRRTSGRVEFLSIGNEPEHPSTVWCSIFKCFRENVADLWVDEHSVTAAQRLMDGTNCSPRLVVGGGFRL